MDKIKLIFITVLLVCIPIFGMDPEKTGIVLIGEAVVLNLVTYYLDPDSLVAYAAINKASNWAVLDLIEKRKKLLPKKPHNYIEMLQHKYRASCAFVHRPFNNQLELVLHQVNKEMCTITKSPPLDDFSCLPVKPCLFFNEEGFLSFYSFGGMHLVGDNHLAHKPYVEGIMRYDFNGKELRCVLSTKNTQELITRLDMFFSYPYLLKAILNSTQVKDIIGMANRENCLEFMLEGVKMPSNYKEHVPVYSPPVFHPFPKERTIYPTFESFPEHIRKPIEEHYRFQNQNENNDLFCMLLPHLE